VTSARARRRHGPGGSVCRGCGSTPYQTCSQSPAHLPRHSVSAPQRPSRVRAHRTGAAPALTSTSKQNLTESRQQGLSAIDEPCSRNSSHLLRGFPCRRTQPCRSWNTPKFVSKKVATAFFTVMTVTVLDAMHNWMKLSNQCAT
jgi:hypothetical protein